MTVTAHGSACYDAILGSDRGRWCDDDLERDQSDSSFEVMVELRQLII